MNDNMIINTISKIHFIIVSFILFILLVLSSSFIILQNGLLLDNLHIPNIVIKELYIKWDEKINISIKEVKVLKYNKKDNSKIDLNEIQNFFSKINLFNHWFESIKINKIIYDDLTASFNYQQNSNAILMAKTNNLILKASMHFQNNLLNVSIDNLEDLQRKIKIHGNIIIDNKDTEVIASLFIDINNDASMNLLSLANKNKFFYKINSTKKINNFKYIINLLKLPKALNYWARDAIKVTDLSIKSFYGWLEYNNIKDAYKNIYIKATGNNLHYTYNPKLDAIHTKKTDLEFKNGVFFIRPREAYSYGMYLDKSWLKIDFTKKQELLSLYLLFDGKLNKDMLHILNSYKIKLPFLQKDGEVKTNLKIKVNLITIDVSAKGIFFTKKANFDYLGLNLDIFDTKILLNNYDVKVYKMKAKYKDIATSDIKFKYNAKNKKGDIKFNLLKVKFKDASLDLEQPLQIIYKIRPSNDKIYIQNSYWNVKGYNLNIKKTVIPFNLETLKFKIPKTLFKNKNISAYIDGSIDLKTKKANLDIDTLNILKEKINLKYDNNIFITSKDKIQYRYKNIDLKLNSIFIDMKKNQMNINNLTAVDKKFGNIFINKKDISFFIDLNTSTAYLKDISIYLPTLLDNNDLSTTNQTSAIDFNIESTNSKIYITKDRKILTDKIDINFSNDVILANLIHNNGHSKLIYKDGIFDIYGTNFNELFMEKLFNNSNFKGGLFNFLIKGTKKKYAGELYLQNSTILKYKLLNNTLAFINTIPSLATFSFPSFNKDGIYIETSYIKFKQENNKFFIYDTFLKSNELSIIGDGEIDIAKNKINMQLNLKSDIGINLSKIPLVGYILLNDDSLSTKVKLTGKLDNPTINTVLAKDILIAPLNIIKRTLTLPLNIFKKDVNKTK